MAHTTKRLAAPLALTITLAACATTGSLRSGERAEQAQDYDRAVAEYTATANVLVNWLVAMAAIGHVYGISGRPEDAQRVLHDLQALSSHAYVTP